MRTGWHYRVTSVVGVVGLTMLAVFLANQPLSQSVFTTYVPVFWRLDPVTLTNGQLSTVLWVTAAVFVASFVPLYKPRPRRILDTLTFAQKRVIIAGSILATLGYFKWSHRLPRATLVMTCGVLFVALPAWFVLIRSRPNGGDSRAIIVGDDTEAMEAVLAAADTPVLGYVSPVRQVDIGTDDAEYVVSADGGQRLQDLNCLGGLSRLDEVFIQHDVDTALLAFAHPDRMEFFGALDACYEYGVTAKVHRRHADSVLTTGFGTEELVDVDLEPWDSLDHMVKRAFDVIFASVGLFVVSPVMVCIALAIKLDDGGSILYSQERTASFGDTITVYKFRSMVENAEEMTGAKLSEEDDGGVDPRVTRVGRMIRETHLDELPQLWSILVGDMSVVGPRPERPELESDMEQDVGEWRSRWFVKPGLTGLAQINDATGYEPVEKLRYDIEYIRRQSIGFDIQIVIRQIWKVLSDQYDGVVGKLRN